jgi:hypothetical protein
MPALAIVPLTAALVSWGVGAVTAGIIASVAVFAATTALTIGISKLLVNRTGASAAGTSDVGARVQLPPATDNKLPVSYGSAILAPAITDAVISTDNKTMWFVCALQEVTDAGSISFGTVYYDGKTVTFDGTDPTKIISLTTTSVPQTVDTKIAGKVHMYFYNNGSFSPTNTALSAVDVMSDSAIPAGYRWDSSKQMSNCAFVIVKVDYDTNAGTTSLGQVAVQCINTVDKPGDVMIDYMTNTRYGCGIDSENVDTASFDDLNTYSNQLITYYPIGGGTATQPRYRINGPINTGNNCLTNLQQIMDACDSWLQYNEITGQWKAVIDKAYDQSPNAQVFDTIFLIDSSNMIGGLQVNPLDLNSTPNSVEVQYPNSSIKDQVDFQIIDFTNPATPWYDPAILSPNEPKNRLTIQYPQVNNYIQAIYLGVRRLFTARQDIVISCSLDYSGIQLTAGDLVRVTLEEYGWDQKLFRLTQVYEEKTQDGFLGARIVGIEYNESIYADDAFDDYVPNTETALSDPNVIGTPNAPTVSIQVANTINNMTVVGTVPSTGLVLALDFNYGTNSNSATHSFYSSVNSADGSPYIAGTTATIHTSELPANLYYWSVTARNLDVGVRSGSSNVINWAGSNVTTFQTFNACNANSSGNLITSDVISNLIVGGNVSITSGTGTLQANTIVSTVVSNTQFIVNLIPTVALSNACVKITAGGISGNNVQANTISSVNLTTSGVTAGSYTSADITVNSKGIITLAANGGGTGGGVYTFVNKSSFALTGGVNPPDPINQRTSYGACKIPGDKQANVSTGNYEPINFTGFYPWYNVTSSTSDGYLANSTYPCIPDNAGIQDMYISSTSLGGRQGWWQVIGAGVTGTYRTANTQINNSSAIQVMATGGDMQIQVAGWYKIQEIANTANVSHSLRLDSTISTTYCTANIPAVLNLDWNIDANATFAIYDIGMAVRALNVTTGNLVVFTGTSLTTTPTGWKYPSVYWIK